MKNFIVVLILAFMVLFFQGIEVLADEGTTDKTKTEKTQTKPVIKYDLAPVFYKNMKWKEAIECKLTMQSFSYERTEAYKLTADVEVSSVKSLKPVTVKYKNFGGKRTRTTIYKDDGDENTRDRDVAKQDYTFEVDDNYKVTVDTERKKLDEDFFMCFPAGNFMGFAVPAEAKAIGDTWSSDTLKPIDFDRLGNAPQEMEISELKSTFKLVSVTNNGKSDIATISWTGSFTMPNMDGSDPGNFKWNRTIKTDLTSKRLISTKGSIQVEVSGEDRSLIISLERTFEYEKVETTEEEPKIEPKGDDDE